MNDQLVYYATILNEYGQISIIASVTKTEIELIQQNPGLLGSSREKLILVKIDWRLAN
ncbi:MAG: hypothetical protein WBA16_08450 [Nonlabens sp.]